VPRLRCVPRAPHCLPLPVLSVRRIRVCPPRPVERSLLLQQRRSQESQTQWKMLCRQSSRRRPRPSVRQPEVCADTTATFVRFFRPDEPESECRPDNVECHRPVPALSGNVVPFPSADTSGKWSPDRLTHWQPVHSAQPDRSLSVESEYPWYWPPQTAHGP